MVENYKGEEILCFALDEMGDALWIIGGGDSSQKLRKAKEGFLNWVENDKREEIFR